jgi:hypothetical protein
LGLGLFSFFAHDRMAAGRNAPTVPLGWLEPPRVIKPLPSGKVKPWPNLVHLHFCESLFC